MRSETCVEHKESVCDDLTHETLDVGVANVTIWAGAHGPVTGHVALRITGTVIINCTRVLAALFNTGLSVTTFSIHTALWPGNGDLFCSGKNYVRNGGTG